MELKPIEYVEFIYRTQKQQFKYSWYFYYKLMCQDKNTLSPAGAFIITIINIQIANKTLQILNERRRKNDK